MPDSSSLNVTGPFTVTAWIKPSSLPNQYVGIVGKWNYATTVDRCFLMHLSGDRVKFTVSPDGTGTDQNEVGFYSAQHLTANVWSHVACVYDGTSLSIYIDGALDAAVPYNGPIHVSNYPLEIGRYNSSNGYCFPGLIDDVRLYNGALDSTQIAWLAWDGIGLHLNGAEQNSHVTVDSAVVSWSYDGSGYSLTQQAFDAEISNGPGNLSTMLWDSSALESPDTAFQISPAVLMEGLTYWLRARFQQFGIWSQWYELPFHTNSRPSSPTIIDPTLDEVVSSQPTLYVLNAADADADSLAYEFYVTTDTTTIGGPDSQDSPDISEGIDSTSWTPPIPLEENGHYFWRSRSFDGFEFSGWTPFSGSSFYVNELEEPPTAPDALLPMDTGGLPVFSLLPTMTWTPSIDPDPFDTVTYKLEVSINPGFTFVNSEDSLKSTTYVLKDSLSPGTHYWWRVTATDRAGISTLSSNVAHFWTWLPGDLDFSHSIDISDLVLFVDFMFSSGDPPNPLIIADVDGSCSVDVSDLIYLVDYTFSGGPAPVVCGQM